MYYFANSLEKLPRMHMYIIRDLRTKLLSCFIHI